MATNYSSWLDYNPYQPKPFNAPGLPDYLFNAPFRSYEQVSAGVDQALQAGLKTDADEMAVARAKKQRSASDAAEALLKENPDLLSPGHAGELDNQLTGIFAKNGDLEDALKYIDRQANREETKRKNEAADAERKNKRELRELRGGLVSVGADNSYDWLIPEKPDKPDKPKEGKVEQYITPEGATMSVIVRSPEEELSYLNRGWEKAATNPLDREDQLADVLKHYRAKQAEAPAPPSGPGLWDQASSLYGEASKMFGDSLGAFQPRNTGQKRKLIAVRR